MTDIPKDAPEPVPATNQAGEVRVPKAAFDHAVMMLHNAGFNTTAKDFEASALATQPATSQEGEDEDAIHDCGNLGWCQAPGCCSRHGTAPTPTPLTLSEDLLEAAQAVVDDYPVAAGMYPSLEGADGKPGYGSIRRLAAALAQVKAS